MARFSGLTRQQEHDVREIVRVCMGSPCLVREDGDGVMYAHRGDDTDEGWSSRGVTVYPCDESDARARRYVVEITNAGRDCDGMSTRTDVAVVQPCKRTRWYWSRNWKASPRGVPIGRFEVRARFRRVGEVESSQRDYSAEAAGF